MEPDEVNKSVLSPSVVVNRSYTKDRILTKEESETLPGISATTYPYGVKLCELTASAGLTLSLGNYEFVRLDVSVKLPCIIEELAECHAAAQAFVEQKLTEQKSLVAEYKKSGK